MISTAIDPIAQRTTTIFPNVASGAIASSFLVPIVAPLFCVLKQDGHIAELEKRSMNPYRFPQMGQCVVVAMVLPNVKDEPRPQPACRVQEAETEIGFSNRNSGRKHAA